MSHLLIADWLWRSVSIYYLLTRIKADVRRLCDNLLSQSTKGLLWTLLKMLWQYRPVLPGGPGGPLISTPPGGPGGPLGPWNPASPAGPEGPRNPVAPVAPVAPRAPGGPGGPAMIHHYKCYFHTYFVHTEFGKSSIKYKGCKLLNNLPDDIKAIRSCCSFKFKLKQLLLQLLE